MVFARAPEPATNVASACHGQVKPEGGSSARRTLWPLMTDRLYLAPVGKNTGIHILPLGDLYTRNATAEDQVSEYSSGHQQFRGCSDHCVYCEAAKRLFEKFSHVMLSHTPLQSSPRRPDCPYVWYSAARDVRKEACRRSVVQWGPSVYWPLYALRDHRHVSSWRATQWQGPWRVYAGVPPHYCIIRDSHPIKRRIFH